MPVLWIAWGSVVPEMRPKNKIKIATTMCFATTLFLGMKNMNVYSQIALLWVFGIAATCRGGEEQSMRAQWQMPARCDPFAQPRIQDLKEELRRTGYRLVISIHPRSPDESKGETLSRDLYLINADGTGLEQFTNTPHEDEQPHRARLPTESSSLITKASISWT